MRVAVVLGVRNCFVSTVRMFVEIRLGLVLSIAYQSVPVKWLLLMKHRCGGWRGLICTE